jgi:hypothetical protein
LAPDAESLDRYLFSDLFAVDREVSVKATDINGITDRLGLGRIDWFKTDSQGIDLRLFRDIRDDIRNRVLAVDIEPGLIDAYRGEDLFVDAHRELMRQGFWLSSLNVKGTVRMKRATLQAVTAHHPNLQDARIYQAIRPSPAYCEARYLRTIESLKELNAKEQDYALLWVFTLLDRQPGFALDLALEYKNMFGQDNAFSSLWETPLRQIQRHSLKTAWRSFKSMVPVPIKQFIRNLFCN